MTETAIRQRRDILSYWNNRNKSTVYTAKLIRIIAQRIKIISKNPESFQTTVFPETRVSALGHFSILYQFSNNNLTIIAFWDNRQNPKKLFEIIKPKD